MRLIDRDTLNEMLTAMLEKIGSENITWDDAMATIDHADDVDAVPVIRCRDCMYWRGNGIYCEYDMSGLEDDYCSWAERKEE